MKKIYVKLSGIINRLFKKKIKINITLHIFDHIYFLELMVKQLPSNYTDYSIFFHKNTVLITLNKLKENHV